MYRVWYAAARTGRVLYWDIGLETLVWISALVYLAIYNPYVRSEFTFCPFSNLGFHNCPGCGLGRSVSFLLHGDVRLSIQTHILGIPATVLLLYRTVSLLNQAVKGRGFQNSIHQTKE